MWYHWIVLAIAAWQGISLVIGFIKGPSTSMGSKVFDGIMLVVLVYVAMWGWSGAMAPVVPVVMGGRRR